MHSDIKKYILIIISDLFFSHNKVSLYKVSSAIWSLISEGQHQLEKDFYSMHGM